MYQKLELLASALAKVAEQNKDEIVKWKEDGYDNIKRDDFLWHYLLQSFSTMGKSSGWDGLIGNKKNYNRIVFSELYSLDKDERSRVVHEVCRNAKIRMPAKKAEFILRCFDQIKELGGPKKAKEKLLSLEGREKKIKFLMQFHGIGKKYARNLMMDVYHEDFRDSIAIDARIKAISELLGVHFKSYEEEEKFYLDAADNAKLSGWEVDRLLYNFQKEFEDILSPQT